MHFYSERGYSLEDAKIQCLSELENWFGGKVLDVFDSSATGVKRRYWCSEADQLRMLNSKVSNTATTLMCGTVNLNDPTADPEDFDWVMHSSADVGKVHTDYVQFSKKASEDYSSYKNRINTATTVSQIDAVFFEMFGV